MRSACSWVRISSGASSPRRDRKTFCSKCGSNLFGAGWPKSEFTSVRLSALDEPYDGRIESHIFVRSLAPWEVLPDDGAERFEIRGT